MESGTKTEDFSLNEANLCTEIEKIEKFYDQIERLSTIYISKHSHNIHIKGCTFRENSGTYGGALTIDSFNGKYGIYIYIYIYAVGSLGLVNNMFDNNYAYFSGGAIYMNLPQNLLLVEEKLSSIYIYIYIYIYSTNISEE